MSKLFQCLSLITVVAVAGVDASRPADAGNLPARGGKNDYPTSEPQCWALNGPTIKNVCSQAKYWWMPLISVPAGTFWVTVTAEGANSNSNVQCASMGSNREGTSFNSSGYQALPQFGVARDLYLATTVPAGGTGMVDCLVSPGGKIHTLSW